MSNYRSAFIETNQSFDDVLYHCQSGFLHPFVLLSPSSCSDRALPLTKLPESLSTYVAKYIKDTFQRS